MGALRSVGVDLLNCLEGYACDLDNGRGKLSGMDLTHSYLRG